MDSFENLIALLLRRDGWWTTTSFKVKLTKAEKKHVGKASAPRWEIDLLAYKGSTNEILAVECKSFLDSTGVIFRNGQFDPPSRYKLFSDARLRRTVLRRIGLQLVQAGSCAKAPTIQLALATGNLAKRSDRQAMKVEFERKGWRLFDDVWIRDQLRTVASDAYENEVATIVTKILLKQNGSPVHAPREP
jgi:hypothetical protein